MAECVERGTMVDVNGESSAVTHSKALMSGLNELRLADKLLDITLLVEGVRMKAHRVVLAACSDYFAAMFTDPMKEASQSEIQLNGVTARGMQILIEYAYTSKLEIDRDCVQDILSAATHVQLNTVVESCATYLECQLDIENCVDVAALADMYSLRRLRNKTYRFICSRLSEFAQTPEMNSLKFEQLEFILNCDYPVDCSEAKVINIVAEYCVQKKVTLEVAKRLFSRIRFNQIKQIDLRVWPRFDHVDVAVHSPYYNVMRAVGFQQKKSTKKKGAYQDPNDILLTDILTNARGMELAVVKIGGFLINGLHNHLSFALPNEKKWHNLTSIPHIEQCNYGIAVLNNDLYVVGGSYDVCLKEYIHGFGFRYNSTKNKWTTIAQIQSDRCRFSLTAVGNHLYAVGGIVESIDDGYMMPAHSHARRVSNCERYDVKQDMWDFITPLIETRSQHAGVGLGRYLYISGGIERHSLVLSSFWRYDTYHDRWEEKCPMRKPRADHVLLAIEDKIYVCGGWYEDSMSEMRVLAETIDVYDIYTNTWHFETKNPVPTFHSGITAVKKKIFFVGGLLSDETTNCSSSVQTYDLDTRQWATHTEWDSAKASWECTCASFYVPRCRDGI